MTSVQYRPVGRTAAELTADVERAVRDGLLAAGELLPSVRALAADQQVAPGTVAAAYRSLRDRGLVRSDGRRGTRVRERPPVTGRVQPAPLLAAGTVDLSTGRPDPALLPPLDAAVARLGRPAGGGLRTAASPAEHVLPRLAALGRRRLARDGVPAGELAVTSGALDAIERVLSAHLRPGDTVAVEDPSWPNLLDLLAALQLRPAPVAVDDDGPLPQSLAQALRAGATAAIVTSRAQNPTGAAVTAERRDQLQDVLASAPGTLVVEDDHAAELADLPLAAVAGTTTSWAFVRSLSKPYGPDLRLAVCVGDPTTIARVDGRLRLGAGWVSSLLQQLAAELWDDPGTDLAIARAAEAYAARRTALVRALADRGVRATGRSGINVWVPVADETAAVTRLLTAGWLVAPGSRFRLASPPGVRLSLGAIDEPDVPRLAAAVAAAVGGPPGTSAGRRPGYSA